MHLPEHYKQAGEFNFWQTWTSVVFQRNLASGACPYVWRFDIWTTASLFLIILLSDLCLCKRVKCNFVQPLRLFTGRTAHRGSRGIALLLLDHGTRRGWGFSITPRPLLTPGKTRYPLCSRLGGPQGRSGQVRKISPPPGFDPRTVQPVVSRYTDWVTRQTCICNIIDNFLMPISAESLFSLPEYPLVCDIQFLL